MKSRDDYEIKMADLGNGLDIGFVEKRYCRDSYISGLYNAMDTSTTQ